MDLTGPMRATVKPKGVPLLDAADTRTFTFQSTTPVTGLADLRAIAAQQVLEEQILDPWIFHSYWDLGPVQPVDTISEDDKSPTAPITKLKDQMATLDSQDTVQLRSQLSTSDPALVDLRVHHPVADDDNAVDWRDTQVVLPPAEARSWEALRETLSDESSAVAAANKRIVDDIIVQVAAEIDPTLYIQYHSDVSSHQSFLNHVTEHRDRIKSYVEYVIPE